ncbi:hypothetical protein [Porphyrobacter sp. YT40]|uniref:hypothetical protein n=1 Tax=Porphyrobacter sp. YT40 TaxID=2547601 RepID=UPI001143AD25|nr:hypothetical protein [Porphyrobacter sp. YT40]QDH33141.1 hypothetical protein E2E27_01585 [Porphyrobacter sp. YT40]
MKRVWLLAAMMLATGCGGPQTLDEALASAAKHFNNRGTGMLSDEFKSSRVEAAVSGGNMLVLRVLDTPTGNATLDSVVARKSIGPRLCDMSRVRSVLEKGGTLRVEIVSNIGVEATSFQMAKC